MLELTDRIRVPVVESSQASTLDETIGNVDTEKLAVDSEKLDTAAPEPPPRPVRGVKVAGRIININFSGLSSS